MPSAETGPPGRFSDELEAWTESDDPKTVGSLGEVFEARGFAVTILVLLAPTATPLPTGGITQIFEAAAALLALQMIAGRTTIWLPGSWRDRELGDGLLRKVLPRLIRVIRWFERWSRPRGTWCFETVLGRRVLGLLLVTFIAFAAVAPPFSGLDTLPALGVVLITLAILLSDVVLLVAGVVVGVGGVALILTLGSAVLRWFRSVV